MLCIGTMTSKVGIVDICAVKVSSHDLSSHVKIAFYIYREDQDYMCSIQCWIASCSLINQNHKILLPMFSHGPPRNQAVACHHAQALDGGLGRHTAWTKMLYSELDFLCATIMILSCGSCVKVTARHGAVKVLRARIFFFFLSNNLIKRYRYSVFQSIFLHFLFPSKFQISQTG